MEEKKLDPMLEKVEPNRRDFIKKVAVGTAYAVPVIASFSLDSVRNKAFAQATYTTPPAPAPEPTPEQAAGPRVVSLALSAGAAIVVDFNQDMDTSIPANGDQRSRNGVCYDREVCFLSGSNPGDSRADIVCMEVPHVWKWDGNRTQILSLTTSGYFCGMVQIKYGKKPASEGCIDFKGANGLPLQPFEGQAYFCND
jgi:hypothetical protein